MSILSSQILSVILHASLFAWVLNAALTPQALPTGQGLTVEFVQGETPKGQQPRAPKVIKDKEELFSKPIIIAQAKPKKVEKAEEDQKKVVDEKPIKKKVKENIITQKESSFKKVVVNKKPARKKMIAKKQIKKTIDENSQTNARVAKAKQNNVSKMSEEKPSPPPTAPVVSEQKSTLAEAMGSPNGIQDARQLEQLPGNIPPNYPTQDRLRRREGTVVLVGYITKDGFVEDVTVENSTGSYAMTQESIRAFYKYRFVENQSGWTRMPYEFQLVGPTKRVGAIEP